MPCHPRCSKQSHYPITDAKRSPGPIELCHAHRFNQSALNRIQSITWLFPTHVLLLRGDYCIWSVCPVAMETTGVGGTTRGGSVLILQQDTLQEVVTLSVSYHYTHARYSWLTLTCVTSNPPASKSIAIRSLAGESLLPDRQISTDILRSFSEWADYRLHFKTLLK